MSRTEALTLGVVGGLVVLMFIAIIVLLLAPAELLFPSPTPTITSTPAPTPTPTFPNFLPTASLFTPPPPEPSPTNTRLPTATPQPPQIPTPTATVVFSVLTPIVKPTATPLPTLSPIPTDIVPTPTLVPGRRYSILFDAVKTIIDKGECTDLKWQVQGSVMVQLDGQPVEPSGVRKVCPKRDTTYTLTTRLEGSAQVERRTVRIVVQ